MTVNKILRGNVYTLQKESLFIKFCGILLRYYIYAIIAVDQSSEHFYKYMWRVSLVDQATDYSSHEVDWEQAITC